MMIFKLAIMVKTEGAVAVGSSDLLARSLLCEILVIISSSYALHHICRSLVTYNTTRHRCHFRISARHDGRVAVERGTIRGPNSTQCIELPLFRSLRPGREN